MVHDPSKSHSRMANLTPQPPKWADRFLEWYCKPELLEAIQGDMWERFEKYVEEKGFRRAKLWYILQVCLFINLYTLNMKHLLPKNPINPSLLQSYFKTGYRNALKNPWTSLINSFGLALATGCIVVVFVFLDNFFSNDDFHEKLDEIYVVERVLKQESGTVLDGRSPEPLGPFIEGMFSQVSNQTRFTFRNATVKIEDEVFSEWVSFADTSFISLFSFPVKWGDIHHFSQPSDVIISEEVSKKYFGDTNPIGKQLEVIFQIGQGEHSLGFTVQAVLDKLPSNASFGFSMLFPYEAQLLLDKTGFEDWQSKVHATFLQIEDADQVPLIEAQLDQFISFENENNSGWPIQSYHFHPLSQISLHSNGVSNSFFSNAHLAGIILVISIGLIILFQVCFTYINITMSLLTQRLHEIGYRKVLGVKRKQIAFQFLFENIVICLTGMGVGILLAKLLFIPWFSSLIATDLTYYSFVNPYLVAFEILLLGVLVFGGTGYPALYISKLKPGTIFHGVVQLKSNSILKKSLLGAQFSFTFLTIFASIALFQHSQEIKYKSWGYNPSNKLVLSLPNGLKFDALAQSYASLPEVESVAGSVQQIGKYSNDVTVSFEGKERNIKELQIGTDYLQKMGIPLVSGSFPVKQKHTEEIPYILVNEEFAGEKNVVGSQLKMEGLSYIVSGVVQNFRQRPFDSPIQPMIFKFGKEKDYNYMTLLLSDRPTPEFIDKLKKTWYDILPFKSFKYFYQDEVFQNYFRTFEQINALLSATTVVSILISLMSLLGLTMLTISQRMKEISIRKVLGAGTREIGALLNREFFWPQLWAFLIGAPLAFLLVKGILSAASPEFNSPNTSPFLFALIGVLGISSISIYVNLIRLKQIDPIEFLRS